MRKLTKMTFTLVAVTCLIGLATATVSGQKLHKPLFLQATAMGTGIQQGRTAHVTLIINEISTAADQQALLSAFDQRQNEGLVNALSKMSSKGRMMITGTLGYDVNYIMKFPQPDGSTKYRMVTDRPIAFGEVWGDTRSMDYSLAGFELIMAKDKKKNTGIMFPACQFTLDKEKQLQLELRIDQWRLVNLVQR